MCIKFAIYQHILQLKTQIAKTVRHQQSTIAKKTAGTNVLYNVYLSVLLFSVNWLDNKYNRGTEKQQQEQKN